MRNCEVLKLYAEIDIPKSHQNNEGENVLLKPTAIQATAVKLWKGYEWHAVPDHQKLHTFY